jgi:hypothetical protein
MKKVFKFLFFVILAAGWVVATRAVHIVRAPGLLAGFRNTKFVGQILIIPKETMGWDHTWVDITKWTPSDIPENPAVVERISELGKKDLLNHILEPAIAEAEKKLPPGAIEVKLVSEEPTETPTPAKKKPAAKPKPAPEATTDGETETETDGAESTTKADKQLFDF